MSTAPLPVIPLEYAKPTTVPRRRRWLLAARWALGVAFLDLVVGLFLIEVETETVLVTGPILLVLGGLLLVASMKLKLMSGMVLGLAHCAITLLFTMLVNVRGWGPRQSTKPFLFMGVPYLIVVALPASVVVFLRMRALAAAMRGSESSAATDLPSTTHAAEDGA